MTNPVVAMRPAREPWPAKAPFILSTDQTVSYIILLIDKTFSSAYLMQRMGGGSVVVFVSNLLELPK